MVHRLLMVCIVPICFLLILSSIVYAGWEVGGTAISSGGSFPQICADGTGGAIITWEVYQDGSSNNIYAQKIDASGNVLWTVGGEAICTASGLQTQSCIISDGTGGAIIAWRDDRDIYPDIYAQRIDAGGTVQWTTDGVAICTAIDGQVNPQIAADGSGGAIITWNDWRSEGEFLGGDIYAQRIDAGGTVQWTTDGVAISTTTQIQRDPQIASDGAGGAIITWEDNRSGDFDIYAQRIDASGNVQWTSDGVAVCTATGNQEDPHIATDGAGGAIITWHDNYVFAQRVNASGNAFWTINGVTLCTTSGAGAGIPAIIPDGSGGAIVTWSNDDIHAQSVDSNGDVQWTASGTEICTASGDQYDPAIAADGSGGAIITWVDSRLGSAIQDIYAQRVNASGSVQWAADGAAICTVTLDQIHTEIAFIGGGEAIITWADYRSPGNGIYAGKVDSDGLVATLLQSYSACVNESAITVMWILSEAGEDMRFFVLRSEEASGRFEELLNPEILREGLSFAFRDASIECDRVYRYRIDVSDAAGRRVLFETGPVHTPTMPLTLHQNYPNPFNPSTTIMYYLPDDRHVTLEVYEVSGRRISCLVNKEQGRGRYSVDWDGTDMKGDPVSSGNYICRLSAGKEIVSRKIILLR